ncbi:MAG: hypothetical protein K2W82_17030 [Candidatus Obscuribacterales bacterium]|nr:hypothetical protein [Candidatus Obscuribacterales bacterium]
MKAESSLSEDSVLVVIDMQLLDDCPTDAICTQTIVEKLQAARLNNRPVLIVEMAHQGGDPTRPAVMNVLLKPTTYEHFTIVTKASDDGSAEIIAACNKLGFATTSFELSGLYADECVLATAEGLAERLPDCRISVCKSACNNDAPEVWIEYAKIPNVTVFE